MIYLIFSILALLAGVGIFEAVRLNHQGAAIACMMMMLIFALIAGSSMENVFAP